MSWFHDTFTEASTTALTSHTSDSGHTWVHWAGSTTVPNVYSTLGGVVGAGATSVQVYRTSVIATSADVDVVAQTRYETATTMISMGVCARLDSGGTAGYLAAYVPASSAWGVFRLSGTTATQVGSFSSSVSYVFGDTPDIVFSVTGTGATVSLDLTVDGSLMVSTTDTSGSRVTAAGYGGVWFNIGTPAACMFLGEITFSDSAGGTAYVITSPVGGQIKQLSGGASGSATVSLTGTYTGTAPNQWRVVQDGTSTAVTGLDWQSFSSSPAGGSFSQSITVPKEAGWLNVQVRDSVGGATATSGKVGTGVLVAVDGQSWAWLFFSTTAYAGDSTLTPNSLLRITGKQPGTGTWVAPSAATMNGAIACGNALVTALGCPVGLVDGSWSGSGLTVTTAGGQWISGGSAGNAYTSSAAEVSAAGSVAATIWIQGQADAGSSVSQSTYYTAFGQMAALRRTALGSTHPYVIVTHPRQLAGLTDGQVEPIRKAHVQSCSDSYNYRVDSLDIPLHTDNVHPNASGCATLGARCAQAVLAALGIVSYYRGPRLTSVTQVSSTVYDLNLTPNSAGTNFTPTSGITGIRALVSGSPVTISSLVQQTSSTIRATLASAPGSMPTFDIGYGASPTITSFVTDNTPLALPLEYNSGVLASAADGTAPTLTGSITASSITRTTYTLTWPAGSDNVAVVGYDYSLDSGNSWTSLGDVLTVDITGRTAGSSDGVRVRARDAAGNVSTPALSATVTLADPPTVTTESFADYSGATIAAGTVIAGVEVLDPSQPAGSRSVLSLANVALDSQSRLVISSAGLTDGTDYLVVAFDATGATRGAKVCTAA
jgi:hypothetical protein